MTKPICIYGNPVLRNPSKEVEEITDEIRGLADQMLEIMHKAKGIGLAAEQIGRTEAMFVLDVPAYADQNEQGLANNPGVKMPQVFMNPEIIGSSKERVEAEEGCLSFPKLYVPVTRPAEVVVCFLDRSGEERVLNAKGLLARALQHEMDHLNGVLLVDHLSGWRKIKNARLLRNLKRKSQLTP